MQDLIIRWLQGRMTEVEDQQLSDWRQASPDNEREFRALEQLWVLAELARAAARHGAEPSAQEIIRKASLRASHTRQLPAAKWGLWARAGVAAGVVSVVGLGVAGFWPPRSAEVPDRAVEFVTGLGESVTIQMRDGTIIRLGPESQMRAMDGAGDRAIWLEGHAFLAVAERDGVPFKVRTRLGHASVLGTRFDIHVRANRLQLVVFDGRVSLSPANGGGNVEVRQGQASRLEEGGIPTVQPVADLYGALEWLGRFLFFQSTPLDQAAREIEHLYGVRVQLADSSLAGRTVTAWFSDQSFEEVVSAVCRVVSAPCTIEAASATIGF